MRSGRNAELESGSDDAIDIDTIKASFIRTFTLLRFALGEDPPELEFMNETERSALDGAFHVASSQFDRLERGEQLTFSDAARDVYNRYFSTFGIDAPNFSDIAEQERQFWTHLMRHMQNAMAWVAEDDGPIEQHEQQIVDRFKSKLSDLGLGVRVS